MGCARFAQNLQNFSERQILWSLCSLDFHTLTLQLPIQTSLSVAPKLRVSLSSAENCHKIRKTSTPPEYLLFHDVYGFYKLGVSVSVTTKCHSCGVPK